MSIQYNLNMLVPTPVSSSMLIYGLPSAEHQVHGDLPEYPIDYLVWSNGNVFMSLVDNNTAPLTDTNSWSDLGPIDGGALLYNPSTSYNDGETSILNNSIWESAADGNQGNTPGTNTLWTQTVETNRFKAFDTYIQDGAVFPSELKYVIRPITNVTHLVFFGLIGSSIRVQVGLEGEEPFFDETRQLIALADRTNLYRYLTNPIEGEDLAIFSGIPPQSGGDITITIIGANPSVAQICFGQPVKVGQVGTGGLLGANDYSDKTIDRFGRVGPSDGTYVKKLNFPVWIKTPDVQRVSRKLFARIGIPTVYFMDDGESFGQVIYGKYKSLEIVLGDNQTSKYLMQCEELS